jgi:hypothetical protein
MLVGAVVVEDEVELFARERVAAELQGNRGVGNTFRGEQHDARPKNLPLRQDATSRPRR